MQAISTRGIKGGRGKSFCSTQIAPEVSRGKGVSLLRRTMFYVLYQAPAQGLPVYRITRRSTCGISPRLCPESATLYPIAFWEQKWDPWLSSQVAGARDFVLFPGRTVSAWPDHCRLRPACERPPRYRHFRRWTAA